MKWLNGYKTWLGIITTAASIVLPALGKDASFVAGVGQTLSYMGDNAAAIVAGGGAVLTAVGLIHKKAKKEWQETGTAPPSIAPTVGIQKGDV